jgi:hypothetical protein
VLTIDVPIYVLQTEDEDADTFRIAAVTLKDVKTREDAKPSVAVVFGIMSVDRALPSGGRRRR